MPEAVIVTALRTPIGTANKGTLQDTDASRWPTTSLGRPPPTWTSRWAGAERPGNQL
jgi:hypothetical protein